MFSWCVIEFICKGCVSGLHSFAFSCVVVCKGLKEEVDPSKHRKREIMGYYEAENFRWVVGANELWFHFEARNKRESYGHFILRGQEFMQMTAEELYKRLDSVNGIVVESINWEGGFMYIHIHQSKDMSRDSVLEALIEAHNAIL